MATATTAAQADTKVDVTNEQADSKFAGLKDKAMQYAPTAKKAAIEIGCVTVGVLIADAIWTGVQHMR